MERTPSSSSHNSLIRVLTSPLLVVRNTSNLNEPSSSLPEASQTSGLALDTKNSRSLHTSRRSAIRIRDTSTLMVAASQTSQQKLRTTESLIKMSIKDIEAYRAQRRLSMLSSLFSILLVCPLVFLLLYF